MERQTFDASSKYMHGMSVFQQHVHQLLLIRALNIKKKSSLSKSRPPTQITFLSLCSLSFCLSDFALCTSISTLNRNIDENFWDKEKSCVVDQCNDILLLKSFVNLYFLLIFDIKLYLSTLMCIARSVYFSERQLTPYLASEEVGPRIRIALLSQQK